MQLKTLSEADRKSQHDRRPDVDRQVLEQTLRREVDGEVRFDEGTQAVYASDASNYRQVPVGVVIPRTTEAVEQAIRVCHEHGVPLTPRGTGTSLNGQCCNLAVILDTSKYLNEILNINPEEKTARVQPGVIHDQLSHITNRRHRLTFGPDTSTHRWATFGGMIGNNSCGVHSVMSAPRVRTSDCIEQMEVLTPDGVRLTVGPTSDEQLEALASEDGRRGEIYRGIKRIREQYGDLIRRRYPDIPRRVSGYNLDDLLPERGCNVARALVGSEGTLVNILEAKVKLVHSPPARSLLVLGYPDIYAAGDHVPQIMEYGPTALEGMDDKLVEYMQRKNLHPSHLQLLPEGGGWLLVEVGGDTREQSHAKARRLKEELGKQPAPPSMHLYEDEATEQQIWAVREAGLAATAHVPGMHETWPGWEDAAVDPNRLGDYLREFRALLDHHGYNCAIYGHFGQACVHCRINFDLITEPGLANFRSFLDAASDLVIKYGGSFSAEHGDGQAKAVFLPKMFGEALIQAFREFKSLWDPHWTMNPGKVVDPAGPTENLRLGADYEPWEPKTYFAYPEDRNSFSQAALRCVGVGRCRRTDDAFMCPSFMATREEKHSTRGRARALFEMVRNDGAIDAGWRSEAVLDALDLCLGCKGCQTECPVSVDMARYKSEFMAHHYGLRRPRAHYAMGLIGLWGELGSWTPGLANLAGQTPGLARLSKQIADVHPERRLPRFASYTFTSQHSRHRPGTGEPVVLLTDAFNDYFYPQVLDAALNVLERLGYAVHIPVPRPPAVRPLIHYGMLKWARRRLKKAIRQLAPHARAGTPIVGLEPSTVAVYRDEAPLLLEGSRDAERLKRQTQLFSEFLADRDPDLPRLDRPALVHEHCHQKAALRAGAQDYLLEKMDVQAHQPEAGCCGLAGAFGFETGHHELSMQIAERHLLPAVRQMDEDTLLIADGFSCRHQIEEGAGRRPRHLAQVMAQALSPHDR